MRSHSGVLRLALAFTALLASMSLVVWRQSRALEILRALDSARTIRAIGEAQRSELNRRIEFLESRSRVVSEAQRLGLHVPSVEELIVLPLGERSSSTSSAVATVRGRSAGASQP